MRLAGYFALFLKDFAGAFVSAYVKTRKQTAKHDADALRGAAARVLRDGRTGLRLRVSPRTDFDHPLAKALGMVIREWRERHGFSAYEVAQRARICDAMGLGLESRNVGLRAESPDMLLPWVDPRFAVTNRMQP